MKKLVLIAAMFVAVCGGTCIAMANELVNSQVTDRTLATNDTIVSDTVVVVEVDTVIVSEPEGILR